LVLEKQRRKISFMLYSKSRSRLNLSFRYYSEALVLNSKKVNDISFFFFLFLCRFWFFLCFSTCDIKSRRLLSSATNIYAQEEKIIYFWRFRRRQKRRKWSWKETLLIENLRKRNIFPFMVYGLWWNWNNKQAQKLIHRQHILMVFWVDHIVRIFGIPMSVWLRDEILCVVALQNN
jgi:hypothetical protein